MEKLEIKFFTKMSNRKIKFLKKIKFPPRNKKKVLKIKNRFERMYQLLSVVESMDNEGKTTTVRDITEYLRENDSEKNINVNIVNSSIRHYRGNGLVRRKHNPYKRPYHYELSNRGIEQLEWLEDLMNDLLIDINEGNYIYGGEK